MKGVFERDVKHEDEDGFYMSLSVVGFHRKLYSADRKLDICFQQLCCEVLDLLPTFDKVQAFCGNISQNRSRSDVNCKKENVLWNANQG